jgi:hypothetical protein
MRSLPDYNFAPFTKATAPIFDSTIASPRIRQVSGHSGQDGRPDYRRPSLALRQAQQGEINRVSCGCRRADHARVGSISASVGLPLDPF